MFTQDIRTVHVRDLNFVLKSEIFVHRDGQLHASHLILGVDPVYSTLQPFSQALIVDSPLLSYLDVRHENFLPPSITVGEARDLGPRYTCSDELAPVRDESAEVASRHLWERAQEAVQCEAIQAEPPNPIQVTAQEVAESSDSSRTHSAPEDMVTRRTLTVSRFIPRASQAIQQQTSPQGRVSTPLVHPPPPPAPGRQRKRQRLTDQSSTSPREGQIQTPLQPSRGISIWEPPAQVGTNVASSSRPAHSWHPTYELDGTPLPASTNVRGWEKGEGCRVAQSLAHSLLLPVDVSAFADATDESMGRRLQWHTIAVSPLPSHSCYYHFPSVHVLIFFVFVVTLSRE